jgi:hypothetical protein
MADSWSGRLHGGWRLRWRVRESCGLGSNDRSRRNSVQPDQRRWRRVWAPSRAARAACRGGAGTLDDDSALAVPVDAGTVPRGADSDHSEFCRRPRQHGRPGRRRWYRDPRDGGVRVLRRSDARPAALRGPCKRSPGQWTSISSRHRAGAGQWPRLFRHEARLGLCDCGPRPVPAVPEGSGSQVTLQPEGLARAAAASRGAAPGRVTGRSRTVAGRNLRSYGDRRSAVGPRVGAVRRNRVVPDQLVVPQQAGNALHHRLCDVGRIRGGPGLLDCCSLPGRHRAERSIGVVSSSGVGGLVHPAERLHVLAVGPPPAAENGLAETAGNGAASR